MSFVERVLGFGKKVILLSEKTEQLSENVSQMTKDYNTLDRRLLVVETLLKVSDPYHDGPRMFVQRRDRPRLRGSDPDPDPGE